MHFDATVKKKPVVMTLVVTAILIATAAWALLSYRANGTLPWANFTPKFPSKLTKQDDNSDVLYAPRDAQTQLVIRPPVINQDNDEAVAENSDTASTTPPVSTLPNLSADDTPNNPSISQNTSGKKHTLDSDPLPVMDKPVAMIKPSTPPISTQPAYTTPRTPPTLANKTPEKFNMASTDTARHSQQAVIPTSKTRDTSSAASLSATPRNKNVETETQPPQREDQTLSDSVDATQGSSRTNTYSELDLSLQNLAPSAIAVMPQEKPAKKPARNNSGIVVIVNKSNSKALSKAEISNIYRDRITRWPTGERILVLNLPLDTAVRQRFSSTVLNMSPLDAATEYSNGMITNRLQNDYRTRNARIVVSYVERHENAIGYVPAEVLSETDDVRVAYTIP